MNRIFTLLLFCGAATAPLASTSAGVAAFSLAPDDSVTAVLADEPFALRIVGPDKRHELSLARLDSIRDVDPDPKIAWSPDSRFLALQYNASDEVSVVEIIDARSMAVVWSGKTTSAAWKKTGHQLLVVPLYPLDGMQQTAGLLEIDAETRQEKVVAEDYLFMGELSVGESKVVARVVENQGAIKFALLRLDLATGYATIIP